MRYTVICKFAKNYTNPLKRWCPGAESNHRHHDFQSRWGPSQAGQVQPRVLHLGDLSGQRSGPQTAAVDFLGATRRPPTEGQDGVAADAGLA